MPLIESIEEATQKVQLFEDEEENIPKDDQEQEEKVIFCEEVENMKVHIMAELLHLKKAHGFSQEAENGIFRLLNDVSSRSSKITAKIVKQNLEHLDNTCENCVKVVDKYDKANILHQILVNGWLSTHAKRDTIVKNNFSLLKLNKVLLGQNAKKELRIIQYTSPKDILKRYFEDKTVAESFLSFSREFNESQPNESYGDFFSSRLFKYIQSTLSPEEKSACNNLPLCIGLYSDGFDPENPLASKGRNSVTAFYIYVLNIQKHHRSQVSSFHIVQLVNSADIAYWGVNYCLKTLVEDIRVLIRDGIDLFGKKYPIRLVQYRGDKKEINLLMQLSENFSWSEFFSPYTLVTQVARKSAKSSADLLPSKVGLRDEKGYKKDVKNLEKGKNPHGLRRDSILNSIPYFHVAKYGMMSPCLHHDLFAGTAREDVCLIIQEIFKRKIISPELMERKVALFKNFLFGADKRSWMPSPKPNSFKVKLPGTMSQNRIFIQYLSLLLYHELSQNPEFLKTVIWKIYLNIKRISELVCSHLLSESQVVELEKLIREYVDLRISIKTPKKSIE